MSGSPKFLERSRRLLGEEFLSIFLSLGLLVGVLSMLVYQTMSEFQSAKEKAIDTTSFAISTSADNLSAVQTKADSIALLAARRMATTNNLPAHLEEQLTAIVQDDRDIAGYLHINAVGEIVDSFIF